MAGFGSFGFGSGVGSGFGSGFGSESGIGFGSGSDFGLRIVLLTVFHHLVYNAFLGLLILN